ncbi:amine sulfotransferase-like [Brienomyrus brachyistius]|uniref:amine sulfotransferase-like n=1 Tax=Brienomyrus brachyistius TaxID=42636 RepID=UPI0020B248F3|nr:amine sulfotransferase-like [Brienomyrus brachyistius]
MADAPVPKNQTPDYKLFSFQDFNLISGIHLSDEVEQIKNWAIRDSDVFLLTYPKSGTTWLKQILTMIEAKGDITATSNQMVLETIPWIEVLHDKEKFTTAASPRIRSSHLPYKLLPRDLTKKRGKVIYVARNPKDVLVSYFHFHNCAVMLETPKDFNDFFEKFMQGKVFASNWFEHIKSWYLHRHEMDHLYVTYEEMIQDLRAVVERICCFLGKDLSSSEMDNVVMHSTFENMSNNSSVNYKRLPETLLNHQKGAFMRKGTVGNWKKHFTVAQSERFDLMFQEEMKNVPLSFVWDIKDLSV